MTRKEVNSVGSPVYQITIGNIASMASAQFDLDTGIYKKYIPFDYISIMNVNADGYELILNDVHHFAIPGSASVALSDISFRRFTIHNISPNPLVGADMYVSVQHTPLTADKVARKPKGLMDYIPLAGFLMR